jgi:hypothetical protein
MIGRSAWCRLLVVVMVGMTSGVGAFGCLFSAGSGSGESDGTGADVAPDVGSYDVASDATGPRLELSPSEATNLYKLSRQRFELALLGSDSPTCESVEWSVTENESVVSLARRENDLAVVTAEKVGEAVLSARCPNENLEVEAALRVREYPDALNPVFEPKAEIWAHPWSLGTEGAGGRVDVWRDATQGQEEFAPVGENFEDGEGPEDGTNVPTSRFEGELFGQFAVFDGQGDTLITDPGVVGGSFTAFVAFKPTNQTGIGQLLAGCGEELDYDLSQLRYRVGSGENQASQIQVIGVTTPGSTTRASLSADGLVGYDQWSVLAVRLSQMGQVKLYSGTQLGEVIDSATDSTLTTFGVNQVGRRCTELGNEFEGEFGEVILYDEAIDEGEIEAVLRNMMSRYGGLME